MCPSDMMHALPLHALMIQNGHEMTTLLERNPLVYCASLITYAQYHQRVTDSLPRDMTAKDVLAVYEPSADEKDFDVDEQLDIYENSALLGAQIQARNSLCGAQVTPELVKDIVKNSHLIYFHGHCDLVRDNITEQSLRLSDGRGGAADFTMQEFFNLQMDASLFLLTACNSATQQVLIGNESLGLLTALLVVGASSVVGILWEVSSGSARIFAERFMKQLVDAGSDSFIDLAVTLQQTAVSMMRDYDTMLPYHWAPFVLHGACYARNLGIVWMNIDLDERWLHVENSYPPKDIR